MKQIVTIDMGYMIPVEFPLNSRGDDRNETSKNSVST